MAADDMADEGPTPLIIITDAGQDTDDEMALVLLRALVDLGLVEPLAVVANLRPARARARLVRGTLDVLGLGRVPVACGSDGGSATHEDTFSESAARYLPADGDGRIAADASALLEATLAAAAPRSVVLLLISSLTDAAAFAAAHAGLFASKLRGVTVMGGAAPVEASAPAPASAPASPAASRARARSLKVVAAPSAAPVRARARGASAKNAVVPS